jgi:hypothetical protein
MSESKVKCCATYCREDALTGTIIVKTSWGNVRITPSKNLRKQPLCKKHLLELLNGEDVSGLSRVPGSGVRFARKALCQFKKESVTADDCFSCYATGNHPHAIKHLICQDTNLKPSPLERPVDPVVLGKD